MTETKGKKAAQAQGLYAKLLELQRGCRSMAPDASGYGYSYVSGAKLLDYIRPAMDDLGLLLIPSTAEMEQRDVVTSSKTDRDGRNITKTEVLVTLHKTYTWKDVDSGESLTVDFVAQGCNGWDKSLGSAETYAERYFLLKFFHIATDEDDNDNLKKEGGDVSLVTAIAAMEAAPDRRTLIRIYQQYKPYFDGNEDFDDAAKSIVMRMNQGGGDGTC